MPVENDLLPFMKGVGIGKNGSHNLDRKAAEQAMDALMRGRFNPVTFGAFFMGLRYKGETAEEVAGFLDGLNSAMCASKVPPPERLLNCAGAYDGKARTCNVSIPAALISVAAGVPVALHGTPGVPTKHGMTIGHVLNALGVSTQRSLEQSAEDLHDIGVAYVDQRAFHPRLHNLLEFRNQMGKRTILNTLEPLLNPFGATRHLGGFFHDPYAELVCHALQFCPAQFTHTTLVKGIEGSDELRPGGVFMARLIDGEYTSEVVDSETLGLPVHISDLSAPTESVESRVNFSRQLIEDLLKSPAQESGFKNAVLLNGAVRIYAGGLVPTMPQAVKLATESLAGGGGLDVLRRWQDLAQNNTGDHSTN